MSFERNCPECGTELKPSARSCSCGWGKTGQRISEGPKDYSCAAYGCPLPGSISSGIGASGTFYCRFHFGHPVQDFAEISRKIRTGEILDAEKKGKKDYLEYITDKMSKEGMKEFQGNISSYVRGKS